MFVVVCFFGHTYIRQNYIAVDPLERHAGEEIDFFIQLLWAFPGQLKNWRARASAMALARARARGRARARAIALNREAKVFKSSYIETLMFFAPSKTIHRFVVDQNCNATPEIRQRGANASRTTRKHVADQKRRFLR